MGAFPRRLILGVALVAMAAGLVHGARPARAAGVTVTVANFSFTDVTSGTSTTTIQAGDTVTWTWADTGGVPHTTSSTSVPGGASTWDSGSHASPFSYGPVTFSVPGTYTYVCNVHPAQMTGTIIVQAAIVQAASTPTPSPTNTAVAATATSAPNATDTPMPTATGAAASPTTPPAPATAAPGQPSLIATTPGAGVASNTGGPLPRAGTGTGTSGGRRSWLMLTVLGMAGGAILAGGVMMRRRGSR